MRPLGLRVLIRRLPAAKKIGSIHIPEQAQRTPLEGRVEAVGSMVDTVKVGDQVLFGRYNTTPIEGSPDLALVWLKDLLAVLDD